MHSLDDLIRQETLARLNHFGGHRENTAKSLGVGVRTLGMWMKKWKATGQTGNVTLQTSTEELSTDDARDPDPPKPGMDVERIKALFGMEGAIAECSHGALGLITEEQPKEVDYGDEKVVAYVGIHLTNKLAEIGSPWSSRNPIVRSHVRLLEG